MKISPEDVTSFNTSLSNSLQHKHMKHNNKESTINIGIKTAEKTLKVISIMQKSHITTNNKKIHSETETNSYLWKKVLVYLHVMVPSVF